MGKVKQRRQRGARYNPTGMLNNGASADEAERDSPANPTAGLRVISEKLSSVIAEERVNGLNTLAALALDEESLSIIVNDMMVEKVAPLLKDSSTEVRLAAAGALRNISAGGTDEVVEAMVQQDVLSPLSKLLQEYRDPWTPAQKDHDTLPEGRKDPQTEVFIQATHLLWNLCECNEEAMKSFNHDGLVHILLLHLDPTAWGHNLALAAAECLLCVSENNPSAASVLLPAADSLVSYISRPADSAVDLRFAVTIAGLLLNISYCTTGGDNFQLVLRLLSTVLDTNTVDLVVEYCRSAKANNGIKPSMTPQDQEHLITAQQLALEILSNFCCPDDDDDSWDECESESVDGAENGMEDDAMDLEDRFSLPPEVLEGIKHFQLFKKTLKKANYPEEDICQELQTLKYGPSLLNKLSALRVRALLSLQNMVGSLDQSELGGSELMYSTWVNLGIIAFKTNCGDNQLVEAAAGAMRAVMDRLSQDKCEKLAGIMQEDLQLIFEAGVSCPMASVRANLARMVGMLGCLMVTQNNETALYSDATQSVLAAATEYLLRVAGHDKELWVSAEALDVIIDLYSDDKTDKLAQQVHLVDTLKEIQPQFKSKHQQQKKKLGDHRALVLTVRDNLVAFIKYKGPRAARFKST
ncbi:HEAT repeat-containing protein 3-like isoform X2 [Penaeus japonicus]|uniref:HEAT repeat-containing protein 3-like isoform X2 n=1 Tax=Penaeus japonicus TaxID=27405 RepID=UPI001C7154F2|nr:HEAT repeat-containing protein 3-like isoform X2 [Penaeus japonicus]